MSMTASTPVIEAGATISINLIGVGTAWTSGTVFGVSGGTAPALSGVTVINGTTATATFYAGTAAGTLTLDDGTNTFDMLCFAAVANEHAGNGYRIPVNSLDIWRAARDGANLARCEVVAIGDSTESDSGAQYSWLYEVRRLSIAAGFVDGGRGVVHNFDTATRSGPTDNLSSIQAQTGFAGTPDAFDYIDQGAVFKSITPGDNMILQGYGRYIRLHYTQYAKTGKFSYQVDSGSVVVIDAFTTGAAGHSITTGSVLIDTGSEGFHTLTIINTGTVVPAPTIPSISSTNATPGLTTPTTKYYVATITTASGETTASAEVSHSFPNASNDGATVTINTPFNTTTGLTGAKIYRGDAPGGPYELMGANTGSTSTQYTYTDNGSVTPQAGVNPPVTNTAGISTNTKECRVLPDFMKAVGIVYHKNARSGWSNTTADLAAGSPSNWKAEVALGLLQQTSPKTPAARPQFRVPLLTLYALGINDQQTGQRDTAPLKTGLQNWIDYSTASGADKIVIIPHYKYAASPSTRQPFIDAAKQIAVYNNCAWCDFNVPLDNLPYTGQAGPHINQTGYNAEAVFLWDNVLTEPPSYPMPGPDYPQPLNLHRAIPIGAGFGGGALATVVSKPGIGRRR